MKHRGYLIGLLALTIAGVIAAISPDGDTVGVPVLVLTRVIMFGLLAYLWVCWLRADNNEHNEWKKDI